MPWQPWFFGRNGDPQKGFDWTYHFFWGLEDVIAVFTNMWSQVETNKTRFSDRVHTTCATEMIV